MITAGDFRNGKTFELEGGVWQIVEFQHVKPGKGAAFVRTKIKNVITGSVIEKPESYRDVKSAVVADYQKFLEEKWVKKLRKKYKVVVDKNVLKTVNNHD